MGPLLSPLFFVFSNTYSSARAKRAGLRRHGVSGLTRARSGGKFGGAKRLPEDLLLFARKPQNQKPCTHERVVCRIGEERFALRSCWTSGTAGMIHSSRCAPTTVISTSSGTSYR